ncbi:MAG: hypothetical protein IJS15_03625 [Victivallales bacterium]|nr:hypothetical protein [Victivallales bacterium]
MKQALKFLGVMVSVLMLLSCNSVKGKNTLFFITLHEQVPSSEMYDGGMVMTVQSADGRQRRNVRAIPIISSAYVHGIEVIAGRDSRHWGLRLYLDDVAKGLWAEAFHYRRGAQIAVLVDGFLAGFSNVGEKRMQEGILELDDLWNRQEAEAIAGQAQRNHKAYDIRPF